jgi:hypothetical protein
LKKPYGDPSLFRTRASTRRSPPDHALDPREPHPDLLQRVDPLHDLASLLKTLGRCRMELAHVLVKTSSGSSVPSFRS